MSRTYGTQARCTTTCDNGPAQASIGFTNQEAQQIVTLYTRPCAAAVDIVANTAESDLDHDNTTLTPLQDADTCL